MIRVKSKENKTNQKQGIQNTDPYDKMSLFIQAAKKKKSNID